jgi:hypothetical protein
MNKILIFILFILVIYLLYKILYTDTFIVSVNPITIIYSSTNVVPISIIDTQQDIKFPNFTVTQSTNNGTFVFSFLLTFSNPSPRNLFLLSTDTNDKVIEIVLNEDGTITNTLHYSNSEIFKTTTNVSNLLKVGNNIIFIYTIQNNNLNINITDYYALNFNDKFTTKNGLFKDQPYNINNIKYSNYQLQIYNIKLTYILPNIIYNTNILILPPPPKPVLIVTKPQLTPDSATRLANGLFIYMSFNSNTITTNTNGSTFTPDKLPNTNMNPRINSTITNVNYLKSSDFKVGNGSIFLKKINSNYVTLGSFTYNPPAISLANNIWNMVMSVSFWMNSSNSDINGSILQLGTSYHVIYITIDSNNNFNLIFNMTLDTGAQFSSVTKVIYDQYEIVDNVWTHVIINFDNINNSTSLYINGVVMNTTTLKLPAKLIDFKLAFNMFTLGGAQIPTSSNATMRESAKYKYNGNLDDFRIYNRILDPIDIYNLKYYT